ncbi:MAG: tRNA pseudouridine(55) synthase TruB [Patescibacteria group bacterium]
MQGFLLIDKGEGLTSFDVISRIRRWTGERRVGHAGTLDPLATGLLVVAVGKATKLLQHFVGLDKEYETKARFGAVSDTYDREGKIVELNEVEFGKFGKISLTDLENLIHEKFSGEIDQVPPKYSALKINGKKAADLARKGVDFEMKSRKVKIYSFNVVDFKWPEVSFKIHCGSGTYIRSLIHDIGQELGCGAYVTELRRGKVGNFSVNDEKVVMVGREFDFTDKNIENYLIPVELMAELCKNHV